jgi:VWFA-related protein
MLGIFCLVASPSLGQTTSTQKSSTTQQPSSQTNTGQSTSGQSSGQQSNVPAEAGGPQGDIGPIATPKKKPEEQAPQQEPKPPRIKNPEGLEDFSLRVNVPLVNVDVGVLTKDGQFVPGLKKENFKVFEDGQEQPVTAFSQTEAPITAVLLSEFASPNWMVNQQYGGSHIRDMLYASYIFVQSLKKEDWIAFETYDMKPTLQVDFTRDKNEVLQSIQRLYFPGFSETNVFDALYDTIDRLEGIEGRKYIIYVGGGIDTFSKLTLDKFLAKLKTTRDITIYCVSTGGAFRAMGADSGAIAGLNFAQADNQLNTFARMTGGRAYFPRFVGEMPAIFQDIAQTIRNQYQVSYHPTNTKQDGSYRKLKVELVGENGGPLKIVDQKGKSLKFQLIYREGYRAKQVVE